jgi:hypothetical protein
VSVLRSAIWVDLGLIAVAAGNGARPSRYLLCLPIVVAAAVTLGAGVPAEPAVPSV